MQLKRKEEGVSKPGQHVARRPAQLRMGAILCSGEEPLSDLVRRAVPNPREILVVRNRRDLDEALGAVDVATLVALAPGLEGLNRSQALERCQRRWPGTLSIWCTDGQPPSGPWPMTTAVYLPGPARAGVSATAKRLAQWLEDGRSEREGEREAAEAFASLHGLKGLRAMLCVLLSHRVPKDRLHLLLGQEKARFNSFCSKEVFPATGVRSLLDLSQVIHGFSERRARTPERSGSPLRTSTSPKGLAR